jgi:hypothetical protein
VHIKSTVAAVAVALISTIGISTPANAAQEWGAVDTKPGHDFTIRSSTSTSSTKIGAVSDPGWLYCYYSGCGVTAGGSYKCWSGGPSGSDWVAVEFQGKKRWVAYKCVGLGRAPVDHP